MPLERREGVEVIHPHLPQPAPARCMFLMSEVHVSYERDTPVEEMRNTPPPSPACTGGRKGDWCAVVPRRARI